MAARKQKVPPKLPPGAVAVPDFEPTKDNFNRWFLTLYGIEPRSDHSHANPDLWIDEPVREGRIRTTCQICGGFVGYRREAPQKRGRKRT